MFTPLSLPIVFTIFRTLRVKCIQVLLISPFLRLAVRCRQSFVQGNLSSYQLILLKLVHISQAEYSNWLLLPYARF